MARRTLRLTDPAEAPSLPRVAIVSSSPMLAEGAASTLRPVGDGAAGSEVSWDVALGVTGDPPDACVPFDDGIASRRPHGAGAQLASGTRTGHLRAAVAALWEGLSVHEVPGAVRDADHDALRPRELEVIELLGTGLRNRDIGGALSISAHTARYQVGQILAEVAATTQTEAGSESLRHSWVGL